MDADFSIELGRDDPVLDFPWTDSSSKLAYLDLKRHPELLSRVEEAARFPELAAFLHLVNSSLSLLESVKSDVWATSQLSREEDIYGASHKCASYVDLVFSDHELRFSFAFHELFCKRLVELLRRTPETPSSSEVCVRRCHFQAESGVEGGYCCCLYVSGYGADEPQARQNWGIALRLSGNAILQLSAAGLT